MKYRVKIYRDGSDFKIYDFIVNQNGLIKIGDAVNLDLVTGEFK